MPANVSALILDAGIGQELTCQALNHTFQVNGKAQERGVLTHYAAQALSNSATTGDWLKATTSLCDADVQQGRLPRRMRLALTLAGKSDQRLTGEPER